MNTVNFLSLTADEKNQFVAGFMRGVELYGYCTKTADILEDTDFYLDSHPWKYMETAKFRGKTPFEWGTEWAKKCSKTEEDLDEERLERIKEGLGSDASVEDAEKFSDFCWREHDLDALEVIESEEKGIFYCLHNQCFG